MADPLPAEAATSPFRDTRIWLMAAFGFASGLPLPLSGFTLRQWMSEGGLSLGAIGLTANIGLAYTVKFLWAPFLDQAPPGPLRRLGRRRGWLATIQPALAVACVCLALSEPQHAPALAVLAAACVAFLSASQDVVVDAWRIETFPQRNQGAALASYVWGYRAALLVSGAGAIALVGPLGWHGALMVMAGLSATGLITTAIAPEPAVRARIMAASGLATRVAAAIVNPLAEFMTRPGARAIIAFVLLYRLGEAMAGVMLPPFYRSLGFDRAAVALANGPASLAATLAGITLGGWLIARMGLARALVSTSVVQMLAMFMYVGLAYTAGDHRMLIATAMTEAFTEGLTDAAFITYLSGLCSVTYTATQYALLSSLAAVASRTVGGLSGFLAQACGWPVFYALTASAILPSICVMVFLVSRYPVEGQEKQGQGSALDPQGAAAP